jgi:large subunit ribosomal protein L9
MKVLLIKDVYKLGHAGEVKKVADGYGRNYLLPQGLAILATTGSLKQSEGIRSRAAASRQVLNAELGGLAGQIEGLTLNFTSKAGETGKLYGSITTQTIAEELSKLVGTQIDRKQVETQPIRTLGDHKAKVRLTMDLMPEIKVVIYREGEAIAATPAATPEKKAQEEVEPSVAEVEEYGAVEVADTPTSAEVPTSVAAKETPTATEETASVVVEAVEESAEESKTSVDDNSG